MTQKPLEEVFARIRGEYADLGSLSDSYYDSWRMTQFVSDDEKVAATIVRRLVESGSYSVREQEYNGILVFDTQGIRQEPSMEKWYQQESGFKGLNRASEEITQILSAHKAGSGYFYNYKTRDGETHGVFRK